MKFRKLNANEIECRVSTIKANGLSLLLYKDARCDMNMLDEIVGAEFWQRDHKEVKGNVYCGVSIYVQVESGNTEELDGIKTLISPPKYQWITKWDAGAESYTEKVKGEASDSFKRACFNWGIGRELYTSPFIWIKPNQDEFIKYADKGKDKYKTYSKFSVSEIGYKDDAINYLVIIDQNGQVRFTYGDKVIDKKTLSKLLDLNISYNDMLKWANHYGITYEDTTSLADICKQFSNKQAKFIIDRFERKLK